MEFVGSSLRVCGLLCVSFGLLRIVAGAVDPLTQGAWALGLLMAAMGAGALMLGTALIRKAAATTERAPVPAALAD
ncbi:hypothetical protein ASF43_03130 [Pseudorhodoferax sp. Leaf267]|nr:hypothetical protein ASF43_03130 [Pseudorhodoferax sp. Leaf267]